jgi:DNA repair exonuclease SbcCD ATPase subunit
MKITYVKAKCFLSIGLEPIEINFSKLKNIVNIRGYNFDRRAGSSNGSGKSSVTEMIVYGLYGNVLKEMSHKEVINVKIKKGLEVEVHFEMNGNAYRVIRKRKPDGLELWCNDVDVSLGGMPATQVELERIIGLTYKAFTNIAFFGQHNLKSFLKCDAATKRQIVENLLSLEKYNRYCATAKEKKKKIEVDLLSSIKDYENAVKHVSVADTHSIQLQQQQSHWNATRHTELKGLKIKLAAKDDQIKNTDHGAAILAYQQSQEELPKVREKIVSNTTTKELIEKKYEELKEKLDVQKADYHSLGLKISTIDSQIVLTNLGIKAANKSIESLSELKDGEECPVCHGVVGKDNYHHITEHQNFQLAKHQEEMKVHHASKEELKAEQEKAKEAILKTNESAKQYAAKINEYRDSLVKLESKRQSLESVKEPSIGLNETLLSQQRDNIVQLIAAKEAEINAGNPYQEMIVSNQKERDEHQLQADTIKSNIKTLEARLPYYDYWIKGFGDKGIRSLIIDGMMPALNTRVNYWLQFLIDNQIKLTFDQNFDETICSNPPDGDPFVYNGLSGGEHMRIDLAISQAFAYLMMLSTGTCPSIVALDEVATNIDRVGIETIWATICELSRDRQVIVITHDPDLLNLLESGSDTLTIEKRNGFSTLKIDNA